MTIKNWHDIKLSVSDWINIWAGGVQDVAPDAYQRMAFVINLARTNLKNGGGPFAAAIFNKQTGELISPSVNWVIPRKSSLLHVEVIALALAVQEMESYEPASHGEFELVTSVEPCCQCLGVLMWSGVVCHRLFVVRIRLMPKRLDLMKGRVQYIESRNWYKEELV